MSVEILDELEIELSNNPLEKWINKFNVFDVLKITRMEIRHSNVLAWLLDPNENHGLGDSVLQGVINTLSINYKLNNDCQSFLNTYVLREFYNIDILVVCKTNKLVLCIENKIDSNEHNHQLQRYKARIDELYTEYKRIFIYLTPFGSNSSDSENWLSLSYKEILSIIEKVIEEKKDLNQEVKMFIYDYLDVIRRNVMVDIELKQKCKEIYYKYQKALDLIFEHKPDNIMELALFIKSFIKAYIIESDIAVVDECCDKNYIRFKTKIMSEYLPDEENESGWKTRNHYFYEIKIDAKKKAIFFQLAFSYENASDLFKIKTQNVISFFNIVKGQGSNWVNPCFTNTYYLNGGYYENELTDIKDFLGSILKDLYKFENECIKKLI